MVGEVVRGHLAWAAAVAAVVALGCGGSADGELMAPAAPAAAPAPVAKAEIEPEPLEVDVQARRLGAALRLDITGTGRGRLEGEPFEAAEDWSVTVRQEGAELKRAVNGPVRVARRPAGRATGRRWDVEVSFSVNFVLASDALPLEVLVVAPRERPASVLIDQL